MILDGVIPVEPPASPPPPPGPKSKKKRRKRATYRLWLLEVQEKSMALQKLLAKLELRRLRASDIVAAKAGGAELARLIDRQLREYRSILEGQLAAMGGVGGVGGGRRKPSGKGA